MKKIVLFILAFLTTWGLSAQDWVNDQSFDKVISGQSGFTDSADIIVVEFWAEFNKDNAFVEWEKVSQIDGVRYYRSDIATCPELKKKFKKVLFILRVKKLILTFSKINQKVKDRIIKATLK